MSVTLKLLKSTGATYEVPCESINDAAQVAEMALTMNERPLVIMIDGRRAFDERAIKRLCTEVAVY